MRLFLLLAVLLLPVPALAANWEFIGKDTEGYSYYIDRESDQLLSDGHHRIWVKDENNFVKSLTLRELSCTGQQRTLEKTNYMANGTVTYSSSEAKDWEYIRPDTMSQIIAKSVCKK